MARPPLPVNTAGKINTAANVGGHWVPKNRLPASAKPDQWRARANFRDADGVTRPVERIGSSENKAINNLKTALRDRRTSNADGTLTDNSRFAEVAALWIAGIKKNRKGTTHDGYRSYLNSIILPAIGQLRLRECTTGRLEDFLDAQDHLAANTRRGLRNVIQGVLGVAVRRDVIAHNPARELGRITGGPKRKPVALPAEEMLDFLDKVDADKFARNYGLNDIFRFLFGVGARIGEVLALRWCDVNLGDEPITIGDEVIPPRCIWINGNIVAVSGVGVVRHEGKTFSATRKVSMPEFVHALLIARKPADVHPSTPIWPSSNSGYRHPTSIHRSVLRLRERLGGYPDFTTHIGRKTVATLLDEAGHSARKVADQLGHANVTVTQNTYFGRGMANPAAATALDAAHKRTVPRGDVPT